MTQLNFLKIEDKSGFFTEYTQANSKLDVQAYLSYCHSQNSYAAVEDYFKKMDFTDDEVEAVLYRLRIRVNKTNLIFFNDIAADNPVVRQAYATASLLDKHIYRGACQIEQQEYVKARLHFKEALKINDQAILAYANQAAICVLEGKKNNALTLFNKALEIEPEHEQLLANKLELIVEMPATTIADFARTVKVLLWTNPQHPTALNYAIQLAVRYRDVEDAVSYLKDFFTYYYLENDMQLLMERVFSLLTIEQANEELAKLHQLSKGTLANRVLAFFIKTHKGKYKWAP